MEKENLEIYEAIQQYLVGTLSPEEKAAFDAKMEADPELEAEFLLHKNLDALRYEREDELQDGLAILQQLQVGKNVMPNPEPEKVEAPTRKPAKRIVMNPIWKQLAGIAAMFLIPIFIWFLWPTNLYEKHVQHAKLELIDMGEKEDLKLKLQTAYNNKNYKVALGYCKEYLQQEPNDYDVILAKGICHLELNQFEEALIIFEQYASSEADDKIKGEWYQAMTYLKKGGKEECKTILKKMQGRDYKEGEIAALLKALGT